MGFFNTLRNSAGRKKPVSNEHVSSESSLRWYDLIAYGIASCVGSGLYAVVGETAFEKTGPAVIISTLVAGLVSLLTALCYLEFASIIPASGSTYIYAYSTLGEFMGFFSGWTLTLEYSFAAAVIANAWAVYFVKLVTNNNQEYSFLYTLEKASDGQQASNIIDINITSGIIIILITILVFNGVKSTIKINNLITITNLIVIVFIIIVGFTKFNSDNITTSFWHIEKQFGGIADGIVEMFFCYIGFDAVCTLSSEARNPRKDVPIAIFGTLSIATTLYMLVGLALTGMLPYTETAIKQFGDAFQHASVNLGWASILVSICALTCMTATLLASVVGQPKIFAAMAEDGLLPPIFCRVTKTKKVPLFGVAFTGLLTLFCAVIFNHRVIGHMVSFGCLFLFCIVCVGLIVLRAQKSYTASKPVIRSTVVLFFGSVITGFLFSQVECSAYGIVFGACFALLPAIHICYLFYKHKEVLMFSDGTFSCPFMPVTPCFALMLNSYVMGRTDPIGVALFAVWSAIGTLIYLAYGMKNSVLGKQAAVELVTKDIEKSKEIAVVDAPLKTADL